MESSLLYINMATKVKLTFLVCVYLKMYLSTNMVSSQNITGSKNISSVGRPQSPFAPPKKDEFYIWSKRSPGNNKTSSSADVNVKTLEKQKGFKKSAWASPYQSQMKVRKQKQEKAVSQAAPDDATSGHLTVHPLGKPKKLIFCYYGSSANSRPGKGKFWPEHIDPFLCTHVVFAFVDITEDGTDLKPNNWNDLGESGLYSRTVRLKEKNPDLKILLAVGGWKIGSKPFLPIIKTEETWKMWVTSVVVYLRKHNFDGFDMDWEFPAWRGSGPEDKHKFTLLMKDLYEAFAEESKASGKERLLLTLATASSAFYAEKSYEHSEIHKYIDYMLLMTYNYHGSAWEKHTGHHSPLLPHPLDPEGEQRELYILWSVKYWLNAGVPREKIIMGLATYGIGWKLTDRSQNGVKAAAKGATSKGKYTDEAGILSHYEICENVIKEGWKVQWIEEQKVPYAYGGDEWVGFDSPDSFYLKAATIVKEDLAGAFVWSVEMDDFDGHCGGPKYPLLRTIYEVFTQFPLMSSLDSVHSLKSSPATGYKNVPEDYGHTYSSAAAAVGPSGSTIDDHHDETSTTASSDKSVSSSDKSLSSSDKSLSSSDKSVSSSDNSASSSDHSVSSSNDHLYAYPDKDDYYSSYYAYDDGDKEISSCTHLGLGIHSDPKSCQHFILCMPINQHEFGSTRMTCPSGTLFDDTLKVCNHQHNVQCQH